MFENLKKIEAGDIVTFNGVFELKKMKVLNTWIGGRGSLIEAGYVTTLGALLIVTDLEENFTKDIKESLLANDPITAVVDLFNEKCASRGLEVKIDQITTSNVEGTETPYGRLNGKLYIAETLKKLEAFEKQEPRRFPKEEE